MNVSMNIKDFKWGESCNNLVKHNLEANHIFNFKDSKMIEYITINSEILLNLIISVYNSIKQKPRFFKCISLFG